MYKIPRQSYTEEFKRETVKLVQGGQEPTAVARQLGISEQTLGNRRKAAAAGKLVASGKWQEDHSGGDGVFASACRESAAVDGE